MWSCVKKRWVWDHILQVWVAQWTRHITLFQFFTCQRLQTPTKILSSTDFLLSVICHLKQPKQPKQSRTYSLQLTVTSHIVTMTSSTVWVPSLKLQKMSKTTAGFMKNNSLNRHVGSSASVMLSLFLDIQVVIYNLAVWSLFTVEIDIFLLSPGFSFTGSCFLHLLLQLLTSRNLISDLAFVCQMSSCQCLSVVKHLLMQKETVFSEILAFLF